MTSTSDTQPPSRPLKVYRVSIDAGIMASTDEEAHAGAKRLRDLAADGHASGVTVVDILDENWNGI